MKKQITAFFSVVVLLSAGILMFQSVRLPARADAAAPGCYIASGSADRITYAATDCPADLQSQADAGKCFVSYNNGAFSEQVCSGFQVGFSNNTVDPLANDGLSREDLATDDCSASGELNADNCGIIEIVVTAINVLAVIAGISIVAALIFAGYLYMTARDNAGQIQKAKQRIVWALIALGLFVFTYAILDYLVPGGVI